MSVTSNNTRRVRARVMLGKPPTGEIGSVNQPGVLPWSSFGWIDQAEHVPDLIWPNSVKTYNEMRTDSQVNGLYLGVTLPIRRYKWLLAPGDAREEVVTNISQDLNIPIQGQDKKPARIRKSGAFSWDDFLRHGLLALAYGFYYFELTGEIRGKLWRLTDIPPRPPSTISQVNVDSQGNLVDVKQAVGIIQPSIPASSLVPFVWEQEAGNWFGRSMFRQMYKHWIRKDMLLRVDAMKHERNGLGIPTIEAPPGASAGILEDLDALARSYRAGDHSGASLPSGAKLRLVGTEGSVPDTLASIRYDDEAMARSLLMMFMQLGQTQTGSRALGEQFIDYFALAQESIALWFADIVDQNVIEAWVNWNHGEDEPAPTLVHERDPNPELAIADFAALVQAKLITVDPELEDYFRDRYLLPPKPDQESLPSVTPTATTQNPVSQLPGNSEPAQLQVAARRKVNR